MSNKVSLLTDESRIYGGLTDYPHERVHHAAKRYVIGALCVAEFQFRYNNRFNEDIFGAAIEGC